MAVDQKEQLFTFLRNHPTAIIATVNEHNQPHTSVIYYAMSKAGNVLFITKEATQKHTNIQHNAHVALLVYDSQNRIVVQITGEATLLTDIKASETAFSEVLRASMEDSRDYPFSPLSKLRAGEYVAYEIKHPHIRKTEYAHQSSS